MRTTNVLYNQGNPGETMKDGNVHLSLPRVYLKFPVIQSGCRDRFLRLRKVYGGWPKNCDRKKIYSRYFWKKKCKNIENLSKQSCEI